MNRRCRRSLSCLFALLLLAACAKAPQQPGETPLLVAGSSAPASPTDLEDPLLSGLAAHFSAADLQTVRLDTEKTTGDSHKGIRVTAGLMQALGDILAAGELKRVDTPIRNISGDFASCMAQFQDDGTLVCAELFGPGKRDIYPGHTILWLQVGEETAQYTAPAALYETFTAPLDEATCDEVVRFTGDFVQLALPEPQAPLYLEATLEFNGWLALLRKNREQSRVDLLACSDGSLLCTIEPGELIERIEQNPGDPALLRVYTRSGVYDYRSDGSLVRAWNLPLDITRHFTGSDRYPDNRFSEWDGRVLFSAADGIWFWEGEGEPRRVLSNAGLPATLGEKLPTDLPKDLYPLYFEPRLMNKGRTAVACIDIPGSQSGRVGLAVLDLQSGGVQHYNDVFAAMMSALVYPDDTTVVVFGNGITRIDLASGEVARQSPSHDPYSVVWSPSGEYAVQNKTGRTLEGIPSHTLLLWYGDEKAPFLQAGGERFSLDFVTENFAVCSYADSEKSGYLSVALPLPIP